MDQEINSSFNFSGYLNSDAWLLQSIAIASTKSPATLKDIIKVGDFLNHAIFTAGELQHGCYKLLQDNLIVWGNDKISLTAKGKNFLDPIVSQKLKPYDELKAIKKLLNTKPYNPDDKPPEFIWDDGYKVSPQDLNKATEEYRKEFH